MNKDKNDKVAWLCENCDLKIETDEMKIAPHCPFCKKPTFRIREISISDVTEGGEFIELKCKDDKYPSKRKLRRHVQTGIRIGADNRSVKINRIIDATSDQYEEQVTDKETGEIIRSCKEPLSAHHGRGSERKKK
jgi:hypothetical protein